MFFFCFVLFCFFFFVPPRASAERLLEPVKKNIELVADQSAGLAGHKHFRHIKCGAALLAWPHLHKLSLCGGASKSELIERGAAEEGGGDGGKMSLSTVSGAADFKRRRPDRPRDWRATLAAVSSSSAQWAAW